MKKVIVFSGINIQQGGPLTIVRQFFNFASEHLCQEYEIYFLVYSKTLVPQHPSIHVMEFSQAKATVFHKLYYEYFYFKKLSRKLKPFLWFSLNDCTPTVTADIQCVYLHNPAIFYRITLRDLLFLSSTFFQRFYYSFVYRINLNRNKFLIVQQEWFCNEFSKRFSVDKNKILISRPHETLTLSSKEISKAERTTFLFPTMSRTFKNIELIGDAVGLLGSEYAEKYKVILTIRGDENRYARWVHQKYKKYSPLAFIGKQSIDEIRNLYETANCLIFPSKLETWGLPLSEFKETGKPILCSDLPYAHETVGEYDKVNFFKPTKATELAELMKKLIDNKLIFEGNTASTSTKNIAKDLSQLFNLILPK